MQACMRLLRGRGGASSSSSAAAAVFLSSLLLAWVTLWIATITVRTTEAVTFPTTASLPSTVRAKRPMGGPSVNPSHGHHHHAAEEEEQQRQQKQDATGGPSMASPSGKNVASIEKEDGTASKRWDVFSSKNNVSLYNRS